jgi:hypothetical protein
MSLAEEVAPHAKKVGGRRGFRRPPVASAQGSNNFPVLPAIGVAALGGDAQPLEFAPILPIHARR